MSRLILAVCGLVAGGWIASVAAEPIPCPTSPQPLCIQKPFPTQESLLAFKDYIARLSFEFETDIQVPAEFWRTAPLTEYWGYTIEGNSLGTYDVTFEQRFDATQLFEALRQKINGLQKGGCSHFSALDASVASIDKNRITFLARIEGKKKACGDWPWGGSWTMDLGDISGRLSGTLTFRSEVLPGHYRYNGQVVADEPQVNISVELDSIFGVNANSVAGQLIQVIGALTLADMVINVTPSPIGFWIVTSKFNDELYRQRANAHIDGDFLARGDGSVSSSKYTEFLSDVRSLTWALQPTFLINSDKTGLYFMDGKWIFNVAFTAQLKRWESIDSIKADIENEIRLLESFGKSTAKWTVQRGDTLWSIAKKSYGNGFYFHMLAAANNRDKRRANSIRIGEELTIPPKYALGPVMRTHFVSPGETIYGLCSKWMPGRLRECRSQIRLKNPSIRNGRLFASERLIRP